MTEQQQQQQEQPKRNGLFGRLAASAVPTIAAALIGQTLIAIWWARGESERITRNQEMVVTLKYDIDNYRTPLSMRVLKVEEQLAATLRSNEAIFQALQHTDTALSGRLESMDTRGTRGSELIKSDIKRLEDQQSRMLQVLDANYNLINEHIRSHPERSRK